MGGYNPGDEDLGALVQGPQRQQQGGWTQLLQDPVARSAMLSAGLQLMTGGWGSQSAQMAQVLGAGVSGAQGATEAIKKDEQYQDKLDEQAMNRASREREASLNRDSRAEIANVQNAGRLDVANVRVQGMLERAQLMKQPNGQAEQKFYQEQLKEARKTIEGDIGSLSVPAAQREELIKAKALERLNEARQRGLFGASGQGSIDQAITPATPGAAAPATPGAPAVTLDQLLKDPVAGPKAQQDIQTPEGRERIKQKFPALANEIYRMEAEQSIKGNWFPRGR